MRKDFHYHRNGLVHGPTWPPFRCFAALPSGGSRGGARGASSLILGKYEEITEGRKVSRASTTKPPPLPLPLARGLDPPLVPSCENTQNAQLNPSISYFVTDHVTFAIWYNSIVAAKPTKPANAKVALEGLKQQHLGVDSQIKILGKKTINKHSHRQRCQICY